MPDRWPVGNGSRVALIQWENRRHWVNEGTFPRASQAKDTRDIFVLETISNNLVTMNTERRRGY